MAEQPNNVILDGTLLNVLASAVQDVFEVERVEVPPKEPQDTIYFIGQILNNADSEVAYEVMADRWYPYSYTPALKRQAGQVILVANPGVVVVKPSNPWINLALGLVTILSIQLRGALYECQCSFPTTLSQWAGGFPMMLAMMSILLAHEFGHYLAARYHKVAVTLPYFLPLPPPLSPIGTLGAFIQLRSPFKTKKQLFDIGVAGPIGGLILALPLTIIGVAMSPVQPFQRQGASYLEGNSIFYLSLKYLTHGQLLPSFDQYANLPFWKEFLYLLGGVLPPGGGDDIIINSFTLAAWFGLFVTAMNLLPVGQLDGGHLMYCILGEKARYLGIFLGGIMFVVGFITWPGWLLWVALIGFIVGAGHPAPLNELAELGTPRTILAYIMFGVFILLFMPNPFQVL
jgi:membrane-associated protease RseP (regulator of RpoE activity)